MTDKVLAPNADGQMGRWADGPKKCPTVLQDGVQRVQSVQKSVTGLLVAKLKSVLRLFPLDHFLEVTPGEDNRTNATIQQILLRHLNDTELPVPHKTAIGRDRQGYQSK